LIVDSALVTRARQVAAEVLAANADKVDTEALFPADNLAALHEAGLMAVFLPRELGGHDATVATYAAIASVLGEQCLSTAMVWAMHSQQLVCLLDHAADSHGEWLARAGAQGCLVGSVTSDKEGGADLFRTGDALVPEGDRLRVQRQAPVVTGGGHAGFYLVSMRTAPAAPTGSSCLVCVEPADGVVQELGTWDALGVRGTHSVPMSFDVLVPPSRVLAAPLREIAARTMVPVGHVGWASAWLGAAQGAAGRFRDRLRARPLPPSGRHSDVLYARLAEIRLNLDLGQSLVWRVAAQVDESRARRATGTADPADPVLVDPVLVNNVKLAGSRLAFDAVDRLIQLAGMGDGYRRHSGVGLERTFRDLRSAELMFHNDRLVQANGRLVLAGGRDLVGLGRP
jgi:alkylation response protein AidB-like acyl-CoA dehydrogenase